MELTFGKVRRFRKKNVPVVFLTTGRFFEKPPNSTNSAEEKPPNMDHRILDSIGRLCETESSNCFGKGSEPD